MCAGPFYFRLRTLIVFLMILLLSVILWGCASSPVGSNPDLTEGIRERVVRTWRTDTAAGQFYRTENARAEVISFRDFEANLMHCFLPADLEEILTELVVLRELVRGGK